MDEWVEDELELTLLVVADILVVFEDVNDETVLLDSIELNVVGASVEVVEDAVDERTLLVGTKLDVVGTSVDRITDTKDEDTLLDEIELNVVGISDEMVTDARVTDGMTLVITPGTVELGTTTDTDVETIAVVETAVEVTEDTTGGVTTTAQVSSGAVIAFSFKFTAPVKARTLVFTSVPGENGIRGDDCTCDICKGGKNGRSAHGEVDITSLGIIDEIDRGRFASNKIGTNLKDELRIGIPLAVQDKLTVQLSLRLEAVDT